MTTKAPEQGLKALRRRRMLEPYMLRLQDIQAREKRDGPFGAVIEIQGIEVPLDSIAVYDSDSQVGALPEGSDSELVLQSLALLMKSEADETRLRNGAARTVNDLYTLQAELMLNSALGTALLREILNRIDDLVQKGALQSAKKLSKVQHRLRGLVRELNRSIDESNRGRAEHLASDLTEHVEKPAAPLETEGIPETSAENLDREKTPRRKRDRPARKERAAAGTQPAGGNLRTPILLTLVGIALVVWMLSATLPQLASHEQKELSRADFISSAPIVELVARPPSLYVTLDAKTWASYDAAHKRRLVEDMGSVLLTNGYWGLLLRTPDGRPVARWLVNGGSRLVESERASETPRHTRTQGFERFVP